jgi:acyl transferase domain-containing protein/acyl carrier protein
LEDCSGSFPANRREDTDKFVKYKNIPLHAIKYSPGAYLEAVDGFDYNYFHLSPKEASLADPNQRLFLQTAFEAIEDAGYGGDKMIGSNTGVYLGFSNTNTYARLIDEVDPASAAVAVVGNTAAVATGRLSYLLNLKGPSMVVDTACSASLTALHLACKAIKNGDCSMAIAGGVRLSIIPVSGKDEKTGIGMESADGKTRTFDDSSDGTGSGEGVAALIIKPRKKAVLDGDHIYAIIKGSAANQDGSSAGMTAPNPAAQEEVIVKAWQDAGIEPETISLIEAHGTGTQLGDPIEIMGIQQAFRKYTQKKQFCAIGSVKANIGHLSEAAGMAGLIKAIMALQHHVIPPHALFHRPNRKIDFTDSPVFINTRVRRWGTGAYPRRCGVSGFGMSGTNCHIVLEEAPVIPINSNKSEMKSILTLSAKTEAGITHLLKAYLQFVTDNQEGNIFDLCYTANTGRGHYDYRLALIVNDYADLTVKIKRLNEMQLENMQQSWCCYGNHKTGTANIETGDEAQDKVKQFVQSGMMDEALLREISQIYIAGGMIKWNDLYLNGKYNKVKLPVYPFEQKKCWVDVPDVQVSDDIMAGGHYYAPCWIEEVMDANNQPVNPQTILVFKDELGIGENIILDYREKGKTVIEVELSEHYQKYQEQKYSIDGSKESYQKLMDEIKSEKINQIVHLLTLTRTNDITDLEQLRDSQKRGVYSLFYLTKAIFNAGIGSKMDVILVTNNTHHIIGTKQMLCTESATLQGLGKVIRQENSNLVCRVVDLDLDAAMDTNLGWLKQELEIESPTYLTAYRDSKRYVEEVRDIEVAYARDQRIEIRSSGVYVITGGMGGIGLAVAKYLAAKSRVKVALINRLELPPRAEWDSLLETQKDSKLAKRVVAIQELEEMGTEVVCYYADVANETEVAAIFNELRSRYGKINAVIHGAGVAGDGFIFKKEEQTFNQVLNPKVLGTWILDHVTKKDSLDFFAMFSSAATVFSEPGQGDYAAANAYLDAFADYRNKLGKKTVAINWVAWKETGMAVDYGVNFDGMFKALPTAKAIKAFDEILNKDIGRVLVGEINRGSESLLQLDNICLRVSYKIAAEIEKVKERSSRSSRSIRQEEVSLSGKEGGSYSEVEQKLAQMYSEVLGFTEIDIKDSFFELGGDSVLLGRLHMLIDEEFPEQVTLVDLFEYTSIKKLAEFLNSGGMDEGQEDEIMEQKLEDIISQMEEGDLSIDEVIDSIDDI